MATEKYGLKKKMKSGDKICFEDGTEVIIEKSLGGSWFEMTLVLPEGKKFTFIKGVRDGQLQQEPA